MYISLWNLGLRLQKTVAPEPVPEPVAEPEPAKPVVTEPEQEVKADDASVKTEEKPVESVKDVKVEAETESVEKVASTVGQPYFSL